MLSRALFFLGLVMSLAAQATPLTLFTNFGPGNAADPSAYYQIGGSTPTVTTGMSFTAGSTATLDSLVLAIGYWGDHADPLDITLYSSVGSLPGSALESFSVAGSALSAPGAGFAPLSVSSVLHPLLTASTQYWIVASTTANDLLGWLLNSTGDTATGLGIESTNKGASYASVSDARAAFSVVGQVNAVPLPASAWLLCSGLIGLMLFSRRPATHYNHITKGEST